MPAAGWAALLLLVAAVDPTPALHFVRDGRPVRTVDLATLRAGCAEQTVTVDDPYYRRKKTYRACPLADVLRIGFGEPVAALATESFLLRALDGYTKPADGATLLGPGGYVAFADAERSQGDTPGWEPIDRRQVDPGPFYMVWQLPAGTDPSTRPWPYQLSTIERVAAGTAFPHIVPTGEPEGSPAQAGYRLFRDHCVSCHAINREGGMIGPDLNVPRSIVEYRPPEQIKAYIRNPQAFRYTSMPPHPQLSEADLDALLAYFTAMRSRKYDPTPTP